MVLSNYLQTDGAAHEIYNGRCILCGAMSPPHHMKLTPCPVGVKARGILTMQQTKKLVRNA